MLDEIAAGNRGASPVFPQKGVLTTEGAEILHSTRLLGNLAAHEVKAHSIEELSAAMDVAEHLLTSVYVLPKRALSLPKRKKRSP